ncbi:flagellar hook-basal body complex protein [Arcobacter sp. CECT 8983]|uniref:flagellar hook-basal body complex protein n=2 Tax=unclassified Arcobacter TaxID=2593671 RepID=UPI00215A0BAE|nr:flagellar hook-basal body complex protein [Arcobacter sp. CECT 8983]
MIGALWTGISGLASHQAALDNESHNIANVNTIGYKSSRISFADQMYQDRIGKGSKILDAEKLYVQGSLKLTGVDYDMAINGDGFFTVKNTTSRGSGENYYTRAGNFRMGDNGTLQDAAGNEVQGWAMRAIDPNKDVVSTDPNNKTFTSDYTKLLTSKVIKYSNYIETITAKATDYNQSAKADSSTIYEGAGGKSKASKISDVEALVADYASWLQKLADNPDGGSASSIAQISQVNFKSGSDGLISKEGDQVYVYIDGKKISQNYISTSASQDFIDSLKTGKASVTGNNTSTATYSVDSPTNNTRYEIEINGTTVYYESDNDATTDEIRNGLKLAIEAESTLSGYTVNMPAAPDKTITISHADPIEISERTFDSLVPLDLDVAASRIATYRALADKISEIQGLRATMVSETNSTTGNNDVLEDSDNFKLSTSNMDMIKGILQIKSLIPGVAFDISEIGEISGNNTVAGDFQTTTVASAGEGVGALQSARDALARAITGNQRDVYTTADLKLDIPNIKNDFTYSISIFDKELDKIIPVPNDNGTPPQATNISIGDVDSVQDFVDKFNAQAALSSPMLSDYVEAVNINGNVVIQTLDNNYDVEFSGNLKGALPFYLDETSGITNSHTAPVAATSTIDTATLTFPGTFTYNYSGSSGSNTITLTGVTDINDLATKLQADPNIDTVTTSGTDIAITFADKTMDITASSLDDSDGGTAAVNDAVLPQNHTGGTTTSAINTATLTFPTTDNFVFYYEKADGTKGSVDIPAGTANETAMAALIQADSNITTAAFAGNTITITPANEDYAFTSTTLISDAPTSMLPLDKNNDYSGRQGAGAEFIELVNTIDQTTTQSSLQLKLDTLGISDSAFGEFSVDSTGLITMKQDGAEFAIGQVSIALFNNTRGLNPSGDNLLAKTNESGEPIYNLNNEKTAKIEGKTLELSTANLSESLVNLMVFQRAFEANAKSITTSDQLLNTLINLKR